MPTDIEFFLLLFGGLDSYQMFAYLNCLKSLTVLMLMTWPKNLTGWKRKHLPVADQI
jgi:hypothetical protein